MMGFGTFWVITARLPDCTGCSVPVATQQAVLMAWCHDDGIKLLQVGGPSLFGMGAHQEDFRAFLSAHFQPQPATANEAASGGAEPEALQHKAAPGGPFAAPAANGAPLYPSHSSEPGSPARALPVAGKALSADVYGMQLPTPERKGAVHPDDEAQDDSADDSDFHRQRQHDSASSADYSPAAPEEPHGGGTVALQGELLPPPLAKNRFGALAKRLQVCYSGLRAQAARCPWTPPLDVATVG